MAVRGREREGGKEREGGREGEEGNIVEGNLNTSIASPEHRHTQATRLLGGNYCKR